MVVAPSTTVEERRILRELRKKLRFMADEIQRLRLLGDAESLHVMREHSDNYQKAWDAYCDLRDRIDHRMGPGYCESLWRQVADSDW